MNTRNRSSLSHFSKRLRSQRPYYEASDIEIMADLNCLDISEELTTSGSSTPNKIIEVTPQKRTREKKPSDSALENDALSALVTISLHKPGKVISEPKAETQTAPQSQYPQFVNNQPYLPISYPPFFMNYYMLQEVMAYYSIQNNYNYQTRLLNSKGATHVNIAHAIFRSKTKQTNL